MQVGDAEMAALFLVLLAASVGGDDVQARDRVAERRLAGFDLLDVHGQRHTVAEWKTTAAVVLLFLGKECPVSNGYAPTIARLAAKYAPRKVAWYGIHADPDVTAEGAAKHAKEFGLSFPILLDPDQKVAKAAGVAVVPEAIVVTPDGVVRYRGRIDDRYLPNGKRRDEPTVHDLERALECILAGKAPVPAETKAFGCPLPKKREKE